MSERPDVESLNTYFAKKITSPHNQHAMVRVTGKAGRGKSWLGLSLAYGVAQKVAEIRGGSPDDYFTMKNDLGVMSREEIKRVMTNPKKYTVKFLDDVAVAWNARTYKDKFNIDLNDLIQTFRPNHNLVVMTLQSGFLIDKVPRSLVHYQIEIDETYFDSGLTAIKAFELELDENSGKMLRHYLRIPGCTYTKHICGAPPKDVTEAYEIERAIQLKRMNEAKEQERKEPALKKKDYAVSTVDGIVERFRVNIQEACKIAGIDVSYYNRLKAQLL